MLVSLSLLWDGSFFFSEVRPARAAAARHLLRATLPRALVAR